MTNLRLRLAPKPPAKAAPTSGKAPRYYPAEDVPESSGKKIKHNPTKIRASITPGTILILLSGRFRGKRVVCLKSLPSGLLLVTGPYKINGVPLRRVSQSYVIATSTKINVSGVDVSFIDDEYFSKEKDEDAGEGEDEFFAGDEPKPSKCSDKRKADQKKVDDVVVKAVEAESLMTEYLKCKFSLSKADKPHKMIF